MTSQHRERSWDRAHGKDCIAFVNTRMQTERMTQLESRRPLWSCYSVDRPAGCAVCFRHAHLHTFPPAKRPVELHLHEVELP